MTTNARAALALRNSWDAVLDAVEPLLKKLTPAERRAVADAVALLNDNQYGIEDFVGRATGWAGSNVTTWSFGSAPPSGVVPLEVTGRSVIVAAAAGNTITTGVTFANGAMVKALHLHDPANGAMSYYVNGTMTATTFDVKTYIGNVIQNAGPYTVLWTVTGW